MSKKKVIEILKEVCYAAYANGHPFNKCKEDLFQYEILCNRQINPTPTKEDLIRIKKTYDIPEK